jgi:hypothetical protein
MQHWELEFCGQHLRIEWNGKATFNIQAPIGGYWLDIECFTNYECEGAKSYEALGYAIEWMNENMTEGV